MLWPPDFAKNDFPKNFPKTPQISPKNFPKMKNGKTGWIKRPEMFWNIGCAHGFPNILGYYHAKDPSQKHGFKNPICPRTNFFIPIFSQKDKILHPLNFFSFLLFFELFSRFLLPTLFFFLLISSSFSGNSMALGSTPWQSQISFFFLLLFSFEKYDEDCW